MNKRKDNHQWFKALLVNAGMIGISIMITLVIAEVALRFTPLSSVRRIQSQQKIQRGEAEIHPKGMYRLDPVIGWTLTPQFSGRFKKDDFDIQVQANRLGLRDKEILPKTVGTFRILGLGDSFAFGWGVDLKNSFYKVLEKDLNEQKPFNVEVINAGTPGFGTYEPGKLLTAMGLSFEPDLVILSFYEGNDYINNIAAPRKREIRDGYLRNVPASPPSKLTAFLRRHSIIFSLSHAVFSKVRKKAKFHQAMDKTQHYLSDIKMILEEKNIPFVFILIPDQDIEFYNRSSILLLYDKMVGGFDMMDMRKQLKAFCDAEGIYFYQLSERFEGGEGAQLLRLKDTHFNERGHAKVAQEIYRFLIKQDLISSR